jgi:hypothetical protein
LFAAVPAAAWASKEKWLGRRQATETALFLAIAQSAFNKIRTKLLHMRLK